MADLPPFADAGDLSTTLGVPQPTDSAVMSRWIEALDDASGYIRYVIGQPITAGTTTVDVWSDERGIATLWLAPVTAVTTVLDCDGNTVATDRWTLREQSLSLPRACALYTVTLNYGWVDVPREIQRWTKILAAAQVTSAARGSLGLSAGVTSVAIDDGKVEYSEAVTVALPDSAAQRLKAMFGGPQ